MRGKGFFFKEEYMKKILTIVLMLLGFAYAETHVKYFESEVTDAQYMSRVNAGKVDENGKVAVREIHMENINSIVESMGNKKIIQVQIVERPLLIYWYGYIVYEDKE